MQKNQKTTQKNLFSSEKIYSATKKSKNAPEKLILM